MLFFPKKLTKQCKQKGRISLLFNPPDGSIGLTGKRVPYATFQKGGLSAEAALVMPLMIAAFTAFVFLIQVMQVQIHVQKALFQETMKVSGYDYFFKDVNASNLLKNGLEASYIKSRVLNALGNSYLDQSGIVGGSKGMELTLSVNQEASLVDVALQYHIRIPFDLWGIGTIPLVSRTRCHCFAGEEPETKARDNELVYMAKEGTVFHIYDTCPYLSAQTSHTTFDRIGDMRSADGSKYYPCQYCGESVMLANATVFYTQYGTRYHSDIACRQLAGDIYSVNRLDVLGKYPLCTKCLERSAKE